MLIQIHLINESQLQSNKALIFVIFYFNCFFFYEKHSREICYEQLNIVNFQFQFQIFISDLVIDQRIPSQLGGQVDFAI